MAPRQPASLFLVLAVSVTLVGALVLLVKTTREFGFEEVLNALGSGLGLVDGVPENHETVLFTVRLPRILVAILAGASLAVSAREQGAVAGIAGASGPLGFTIGPLMGGYLYQLDHTLPYWFTLGVYGPLLLFVILSGKDIGPMRGAEKRVEIKYDRFE